MMKNHLLLLVMLTIASLNSRAQEKEIGLYAGFGLTGITDREYIMELSDYRFHRNAPNAYVAGLAYSRQMFFPRLKLNTGINYFQRQLYPSGNIHYTQIPIGAEYLFGSKVKAGIAGGLYLNVLTGTKSTFYRRFLVGEYLRASVGYDFKYKYRVMISWTGSADLSNMVYEEGIGFTGSYRVWEYIGFDSVFGVTLFYTLDEIKH